MAISGKAVLWLATAGVALMLVLSCGGILILAVLAPPAASGRVQSSSASVGTGQTGVLRSAGDPKVLIARSGTAFDELTAYLSAGNMEGVNRLLRSEKAFAVEAGTRAAVFDRAYNRRSVRILDGNFAGRSGVIHKDWIHPR